MSEARAPGSALVDRASHPDSRSFLCRLTLKVGDLTVIATVGVVHMLNLQQLDGLRADLPRRQRKPTYILKRIHELAHGPACERAFQRQQCVVRHPELLSSRAGLLRSFEHVLTCKLVRDASYTREQRARVVLSQMARVFIVLDFHDGTCTTRGAPSALAVDQVRLSPTIVHVRVHSLRACARSLEAVLL